MSKTNFEWNKSKNIENQKKHNISFFDAQYAFFDEKRVIAEDLGHSQSEKRYYCLALNKDKSGIITVRFTYRSGSIRIFGAGYWRKDKKTY